MKIQGPNPLVHAYRNQGRQQYKASNDKKSDQLNISEKAKQLQQQKAQSSERANYVAEIKQLVQSGEYKIDYERTAQKMIDFWTNRV